MEWMIMPLKRYADFSGRSRRKEYWMFSLGLFLATIAMFVVFALIGAAASGADGGGTATSIFAGTFGIILILAIFAIIVPSIAVQVRRFHDQDMSGWFVLLGFIPGVGGIITLVFMCIEGTAGPNRFGPDPKNPEDALRTVFR